MDGRDRGFLLLDKPEGLTSHTAIRRASAALGADKAGHAGTLDPLATGLMLVGLGRGSRLLENLVGCGKTYLATLRLGEVRDTLDREGAVVETRPVPDLTRETVGNALSAFRGEITQIPPQHSAIKVGGVPLHRRTRRGEDVEPPPRTVTISELELLSMELPELRLKISCSSGTYVRSLARDLGEALGCGACLWELRRVACGPFRVEDAVTLAELQERGAAAWDKVLPVERMVEGLPCRRLSPEELEKIRHGIALPLDEANPAPEGDLALFAPDGSLAAIGHAVNALLRPRKVFLQ
jgi:tRNA pseudouridine55 synthase